MKLPSLFGGFVEIEEQTKWQDGHLGTPSRGPAGETCGTCAHLCYTQYIVKRYYKCSKVDWTHGPGTDIRLKDKACEYWKDTSE